MELRRAGWAHDHKNVARMKIGMGNARFMQAGKILAKMRGRFPPGAARVMLEQKNLKGDRPDQFACYQVARPE
jgi:hypothetical protein